MVNGNDHSFGSVDEFVDENSLSNGTLKSHETNLNITIQTE